MTASAPTHRHDWPVGLFMAAVAISPALFATWASSLGSDAYYLVVQEDGFLEWVSFFGFANAALLFAVHARDTGRSNGWAGAWWPLGLAAFCAFVALEEISWGQRLIGYRPPDYFLESNYQQEFNLHNVVATDLRKLGLLGVIYGYGVALPVLAAWRPLGARLSMLGVEPPALALVPAFAASGVLYQAYPWKFTGEWVECMVGLGFLGAALCRRRPEPAAAGAGGGAWVAPLAWCAATAILSAGAVGWTQSRMGSDPARVEAVQRELELLRSDFEHFDVETRCGLHRRLHTFVEKEGVGRLRQGRFGGLVESGLPESRAEFFLDPWNSPYWVRDRCTDGRRRSIYSLGPNRRRDSTRDAIGGDDLAIELP